MPYDPTIVSGLAARPAGQSYVQLPYGDAETPRAPRHYFGTAAPNGAVAGNRGDLYFQQANGGLLWRKSTDTATTGWVPISAVQAVDGWYQDDVAANQTDVALSRGAGANGPYWITPVPGSVVGLWVRSRTADCTAGSATIKAVFGAAQIGGAAFKVVLNTTTLNLDRIFGVYDTTLNVLGGRGMLAGQDVSIQVTTTADWLPTTLDLSAGILFVPDADGNF